MIEAVATKLYHGLSEDDLSDVWIQLEEWRNERRSIIVQREIDAYEEESERSDRDCSPLRGQRKSRDFEQER